MNTIIQTLEDFISEFQSETSITDISELDGFLAAVACSPRIIPPSTWTAVIMGDAVKSSAKSPFIMMAVTQQYSRVVENLESSTYAPLFLEFKTESEVVIVTGWCDGFMRGLGLWESLSSENQFVLDRNTFAMRLFSDARMADIQQGMTDDKIRTTQLTIAKRVLQIYKHFRGVQSSQVTGHPAL